MKGFKLNIVASAAGALAVAALLATTQSFGQLESEALSTTNKSQRFTIQRAQRGVEASLDDQNDYYLRPNGERQKLYRKKDVYLVEQTINTRASKSADLMQRFKGQFGDRVTEVDKHQMGSAMVVRIDNRPQAKTRSGKNFDIEPDMLAALDSSTSNLSPIFTTANGQDDMLLLPRLTVRLNDSANEQEALAELTRKYRLTVVRKLELSDTVYSLAFVNSNITPEQEFAQVRKVMNEPTVVWAEPQFYFKAIKAQAAVPNDALFSQQWNLRNRGFQGSRCDADCDADNAWARTANATTNPTGDGIVIAIVDDGVELNHPDLNVNTANDRDFVEDAGGPQCSNGQSVSDGNNGPDFNASPRATANCVLPGQGEPLVEDNHGTAVAGIAAAVGDNGIGVAGVAYDAQILPIRLISDFNQEISGALCNTAAEAMEYAAQFADVINNSWSIPMQCNPLDDALTKVTSGTVTAGTGTRPDRQGLGSPVVFSSGNDASGWVKVTIPVTAGEHAYEWRLLRSAAFPLDSDEDDDTVWLDDVVWPDGSTESFESGLSEFTNEWALNSCDADCFIDDNPEEPIWTIENDTDFVRSGSRSARIDAVVGGTSENSFCGNSYLHTIKDGPAGEISFWVWVSTQTQLPGDTFEFLVDGQEVLSYGDLGAFGFVDNNVAYPALLSESNSGVIAVGASTSGDLSGVSNAGEEVEERVSYSQYGPFLDLVAPSSDQHLAITTTDRTGAAGFGPGNFTSSFEGTSASAAMVSGVAAAMLSTNDNLSAAQVKTMLRSSADQIGRLPYPGGRNDFHGHGRLNMHNALRLAAGESPTQPGRACAIQPFSYTPANDLILPRFQPQSSQFCPAEGPIPTPVVEDFCFPIVAANGNTAVVCL